MEGVGIQSSGGMHNWLEVKVEWKKSLKASALLTSFIDQIKMSGCVVNNKTECFHGAQMTIQFLPRVGVTRKARYSDRSCPYVCLSVCLSVLKTR